MNERKPVHSGHRERMKEKLIKFPESLSDHELLEILTYYSIPRTDTNVTAHELLSVFGSLSGVLAAQKEELTFIDGVGDNTATLIKLVSELLKRVQKDSAKGREYYGFNDYRKEVADYFKGKRTTEEFVVFLFDKNHRKVAQVSFDCDEKYVVSTDSDKMNQAFLRYSPKYLILAHNHTSGDVTPSKADRDATSKINAFAFLHGARLLDHIIVSGEKMYSFFQENEPAITVAGKEIRDFIERIGE